MRCSSVSSPGSSTSTSTTTRSDGARITDSTVSSCSTRPLSPPTSFIRAPGHRDVEDAGVGGVRQVEAHHLAGAGVEGRLGLAGHEEDVAEAPHRRVRRRRPAEGRDRPVLEQDVVEGDSELPVRGRPVAGLGRDDDHVAVEAHLLAVVLPDVRVVPVDAGVGEREAVGEAAALRDRRPGSRGCRRSGSPAAGRASGRCRPGRPRSSPRWRPPTPASPAASVPGSSRCRRASGRSRRRCAWRRVRSRSRTTRRGPGRHRRGRDRLGQAGGVGGESGWGLLVHRHASECEAAGRGPASGLARACSSTRPAMKRASSSTKPRSAEPRVCCHDRPRK